MKQGELISVGEIVSTYGYQGWVRVKPLTSFPERFYQLKQVVLCLPASLTIMQVLEVKPYKEAFLLHLDKITSKEMANNYVKASICVSEDDIFPLPEGHYYHFQLIGLQVYDAEHGFIGEVIDVLETGANDVYVLKSDRYKEVLLPAIKEVILSIDLAQQTMLIKLLPGLLPEEISEQ